ncbi:MAG: hypothetical protein IKS17_03825 [Firmicutes bacterium]|nr:hypothetical protein [Bacillota bacterium]
MKDFFTEQLVAHTPTKQDSIRQGIYFGVYAAIIIYIIFNFIVRAGMHGEIGIFALGLLFAAGIAILAWRQITGLRVEYEYSYTNGTLDIDIIRNRSRRKQVFSAAVADFEIMAHIDDSDNLSPYKDLPEADFSSGDKKDNTYVFVTVSRGKKCRFIIEPKEELLKAMLVDLTPRRLHMKITPVRMRVQ